MIIDPKTNRPITTEGNDARRISIVETNHNGKMVWAIDYYPSIQSFEFEEVFQILGNAIQGIATNARARKHEALALQQAQAKIKEMNKE